jgi:hypothetical protein
VTGIRWNYESDAVEGFISPADGLPPRPLRIVPAALPASGSAAVALADALWAEVSAAHAS